jgi:hypothetical protein
MALDGHQDWLIGQARMLAAAKDTAGLAAWYKETRLNPDPQVLDEHELLYPAALGAAQSMLTELADQLEQALTGPAASDRPTATPAVFDAIRRMDLPTPGHPKAAR